MRRREPAHLRAYEYFRRVGGFRANGALALARAEEWARNANLELGVDLGAAFLHEKRWTDSPATETHWQDANWEFSEPLVVMPRPEGVSDRVVSATLALRLWK